MHNLIMLAGISDLKNSIINSWIGPIFLLIVAVVAVTFLVNRQFRALGTFIAIVVIVAVLIFGGEALFGEKGTLTQVGKDAAGKINTVLPLWLR